MVLNCIYLTSFFDTTKMTDKTGTPMPLFKALVWINLVSSVKVIVLRLRFPSPFSLKKSREYGFDPLWFFRPRKSLWRNFTWSQIVFLRNIFFSSEARYHICINKFCRPHRNSNSNFNEFYNIESQAFWISLIIHEKRDKNRHSKP